MKFPHHRESEPLKGPSNEVYHQIFKDTTNINKPKHLSLVHHKNLN